MRKFFLTLAILILTTGPATAQVVSLIDTNGKLVGSIIDTDFDNGAPGQSALVAMEAGGQTGILVTTDSTSSLRFSYDVWFEGDGCVGTGYLEQFDTYKFQLRGKYFLVAGVAGDLYTFDSPAVFSSVHPESKWDSIAETCIDESPLTAQYGALTLVEAGFREQFTPGFRAVVSSQIASPTVAAPAVGLPGLLLLMTGLLLIGGIALRTRAT